MGRAGLRVELRTDVVDRGLLCRAGEAELALLNFFVDVVGQLDLLRADREASLLLEPSDSVGGLPRFGPLLLHDYYGGGLLVL